MFTTRTERYILLGLTLAALATRAYRLGDWGFSGDEFFTALHAYVRAHSFVNPAGYALVVASFKAFGVSEWSARLPSCVLGIATVPIFYATWRRVVGGPAALIGAILLVFSAWHLWYSQFARYYTAVFLFGSLSFYAYLQALRRDSLRDLALALAATGLGCLFHVTSVLVPVACGAFSVVALLWPRGPFAGLSRRVLRAYVAVGVAAGLAAAPLMWGIAVNWQEKAQTWGYSPATFALAVIKYVQVPIAAGAGLGLLVLGRLRPGEALFFAFGIGVPLLATAVGAGFVSISPSYLFYALPLAFVLTGVLCDEARRLVTPRVVTAYALPAVILATMMPAFVSHYTARQSLDFRDVVAFVESVAGPRDRVVSLVNDHFTYYARHPEAVEPYIEQPFAQEVRWEEVLEKYRYTPGRTWFVLPVRRIPLAPGLERWLHHNTLLAWRKLARRYDYSVEGYEVFVTFPR